MTDAVHPAGPARPWESVSLAPAGWPELGCAVSGPSPALDWCRRYATGLWRVEDGTTRTVREIRIEPWRAAHVDLLATVRSRGQHWPLPLGEPGRRLVHPSGWVDVASADRPLLLRREVDGPCLVAADDLAVAGLAAFRLARDHVTQGLLDRGWAFLHGAAAVAPDGRALLAIGPKGAGKTATVLALAIAAGWQVLANDRVLVGPSGAMVGWPSSLNLGLGLAHRLGWTDRLAAERPTYRQSEAVGAALRSGIATALRDDAGRELKAQIYPAELPGLGVALGQVGRLALVVRPRVDLVGENGGSEPLADWVAAAERFPRTDTPEHYPDVLGFATRPDPRRAATATRLLQSLHSEVPGVELRLGSDPAQTARTVLHAWEQS